MASKFPVVDMSLLVDAKRRGECIQQVGTACKEWGFFQLINHGVEQRVLDEASAACKAFFALPLQDKLKLANASPPLGFVHQSQQGGVEERRQHLLLLGVHNAGAREMNPWPEEQLPRFKPILEKLLMELAALARALVEAMLESLGIKDSEGLYCGDADALLTHFYPAAPEGVQTPALSAHQDNSIATIVYQQSRVHGLEVIKDGEWLPLEPLEGAFVANVGDILEVWSNGRYKSVKHRVAQRTRDRHSAAYFVMGNSSLLVSPLKEFTGEAPHYKAFILGDYIKARNENKKPGMKDVITLDKYRI